MFLVAEESWKIEGVKSFQYLDFHFVLANVICHLLLYLFLEHNLIDFLLMCGMRSYK